MNDTEAHLNDVAIKQLTWKPSTFRNVAREIVERVLVEPHTLWPDALQHDGLTDSDKHCVGTAYRLLMRAGIIAQTGSYRRSTAEGRAGGSIFQYRLADTHKARLFLERNPKCLLQWQQPELMKNN
jgi:hypothetical protein